MVLFWKNFEQLKKHWRNFEKCCLMNKKIPLFKKDRDIFAHIFWVTLRAAMTATEHTVELYCAVLCGEGLSVSNRHWRHRDQSEDKATPERSNYNYTSMEDIISSDRQGNVNGRPILWVVSLSQASHRPPWTSPPLLRQRTSNQATHKLTASLNKSKLLID